MSRTWTGYLAGAAFALCAGAGGLAYAQSAADAQRYAQKDAQGSGRIEERHIERGDGFGAGSGERHIERRVIMRDDGERHGHMDPAEHLRTMLQLKPSQEPALTAYLAAMKPVHGHEQIVEMSDHGDAKTTPQRLAEMEKHMAEQAARGHARIEATRRFYEQLEPSQKKVFAELPMLMIGPMGPMMTMGPMKVMVNMARMPAMPPMPPMAPMPPHPPKAPPAPPARPN
jgi:hypothetical protein